MSSLVQNLGKDGFTVIILEFEDIGSNFDQEGVKDALVPLGEDIGDLIFVETQTALQDVVGLSDELHVTILDTFEYRISQIIKKKFGNQPLWTILT